jgi:hypothetical protein
VEIGNFAPALGPEGLLFALHSEGVPKGLPQINHDGVQRFEVCLISASNEIELSVRDAGAGFNAEEAMRGHGGGTC